MLEQKKSDATTTAKNNENLLKVVSKNNNIKSIKKEKIPKQDLKENYTKIVDEWRVDFIQRIKINSNSKKQDFNYLDALQKSKNSYRTTFDECLIKYSSFINSDQLKNNDYYKYVNAYVNGKKLDLKYFKHNVNKLEEYYKKFDENKEKFNPFNREQYKCYVLFMMLKIYGHYKSDYDVLFNVKKETNREYNPLTNIPSVIRGDLPFNVKEYDIKRAFPTFIDIELNIDRKEDVYSLIDKRKFNSLLNIHKETNNAKIDLIRKELECVYGARVNEVITDDRFNNKGQMFKDLVKYEDKAIKDFIKENKLENFIRLHDGLFVADNINCNVLKFGKIEFSIKETIKPAIENFIVNFYAADEKGDNVTTSPKMYSDFFVQENFIRISQEKNDTITIFKDSNNIIKPFNHKTDIVPFLKENINDFFTDAIENKIANDCYNDVQKGYLLLNPITLKYNRDTKHTFGVPFKNGFIELTKDKTELETIEYKKVNGFFAPHNTQEREFNLTVKNDVSVFEQFLKYVSVEKIEDLSSDRENIYNSFRSMFGYLIHQYKSESENPCIVLTDSNANDRTRNGGRGKSLFTRAVSEVRKTILKGGNEFDTSYLFNYSDLTKEHDVFIIDDVSAGFNYNALYTQISGAISCQRKGKPAEEIPFKESPKFIITTNWSYRVEDDSISTQRRFIEYQFSDFFNLDRTPKTIFNHILFEDWEAAEWNRFYQFAFDCVRYYLENGLNRIPYNKTEDNFRALFNNDVVLDEMERIIDELMMTRDMFNVSDFLNIYKKVENNLRFENYFHSKNTKNLLDIYIKHHKKPLEYIACTRKWRVKNDKIDI